MCILDGRRYSFTFRHCEPLIIQDSCSWPYDKTYDTQSFMECALGWKCNTQAAPSCDISSSGRHISMSHSILSSHPAGEVSHKPGSRLPLLSTRPAVTPVTLKRAATNFAAWTEAQWVWTVCLLPDSVATVTWTQALLLRLSPTS